MIKKLALTAFALTLACGFIACGVDTEKYCGECPESSKKSCEEAAENDKCDDSCLETLKDVCELATELENL